MLTPADVHHGLAGQRIAARATVLAEAYAAHPERFPGGLSQPRACPPEVWINRPKTPVTEKASSAIACEAAGSIRAKSAAPRPRS